MAKTVKIQGIQFNLEAISQLPDAEAFKAQESAGHLPNADAIYSDVWDRAQKWKADQAPVEIKPDEPSPRKKKN